jgi:Ca2+-transporting ATPase
MQTELGRIAELTETAEAELTPLERRLNRLGWKLAGITLVIAAIVGGAGLLAGQPTLLMIETAIALGVAAIPEGLPIVATIALARGMWLMARRQALVNRLAAVETLGATRVIFTDKTGTLTENRMTLRRVVTPAGDHEIRVGSQDGPARDEDSGGDDPLLQRALEVGVLCNNASLTDVDNDAKPDVAHGDPTETALLWAGVAYDLHRENLLERKPESREVAFDPDVMMMATFHEVEDGLEVAVKGAPHAVLDACHTIATAHGDGEPMDDRARQDWADRAENLAGEGLRLLAVADKRVASADEEPYEKLRFIGLLGLFDPPREDVRESIEACQSAGIRLVMVTGDQPETARAIGRQVGLAEHNDADVIHGRELVEPERLSTDERRRILRAPVFARVSPEQKLRLVQLYQESGLTVAMTGDGVNDAPALKKADIGVAMGKRGTDAARQVADMVLKDDALSSIVAAVRHGRIIFGNIRKSVMFMLCTNVAEVIAVALASLVNAPLPLRPLQILYLNVITDVFPALALGVGKGSPRVMRQKPRDAREPVLTRGHWLAIGGWGLGIAACVLGALAAALLWLGAEQLEAVTVSFLTLAFGKLWFVFNLRDRGSTLLDNDIVRNLWIWAAIGVCVVLLLAAAYLPGLADILKTRPLGGSAWGLVLALSALPMLLGQTVRLIQRWRRHA